MATHGPSFRFAPPRATDSATAAGAVNRLPTRTNHHSVNPTQNVSNSPRSSPAPVGTASRIPAKLRRKTMPEDIQTTQGAVDSDLNLRLNTAVDSGIQLMAKPQSALTSTTSTSAPVSASSTSRLPRNPFAPRNPETVACIIGPDPSLAYGSSHAAKGLVSSKTLRRKPSVIESFMTARRNKAAATGAPSAVMSPQNNQTQAASTNETPHFTEQQLPQATTPLGQPPSRPATAGNDAYGIFNTQTPLSEPSTTPSLRHTDSASVFSRATSATPTSQTSYSPLISQSPHLGPGVWSSPRKQPRDQTILGFQGANSLPAFISTANGSETNRTKPGVPISPIPELAHLVDDPAPSTTSPRKAPARPSRDNTPTLETSEFTPVVFSDLPPRKSEHHRRQSSSSAADRARKSHDASRSHISGRHAKDESFSDSSFEPVVENVSPSKGNRSAISPSSLSDASKSHSRFGFLSRKDRTNSTDSDGSASKVVKKGPMAGTGHEGYGKYALGGRNGIPSAPNGTIGWTSNKSKNSRHLPKLRTQTDHANGSATSNSFIMQNTSPVYLRGSGGTNSDGNAPGEIIRSDSSASVVENGIPRNSTVSSSKASSGSSSSVEPARLSPKDSARPTSATTSVSSRGTSSRGRGSWGSVARGPDRAMSRDRLDNAGKTNKNVNEAALAKARQQAADAASQAKLSTSNTAKKSNWSLFSKSPEKTKTTTKWNPFQRSQSQPPGRQTTEPSLARHPVPVPPRAIAHYEVSNSGGSNENPVDLTELKDLMDEVDAVQSEYQSDTDDARPGIALSLDGKREKSMVYNETAQILTSHLKLSPELYEEHVENGSEKDIPASKQIAEQEQIQSRPSRLAQVGRIPKVVSTREYQAPRIPPKSFSRPLIAPPRTHITIPDFASIETGSSTSLISQTGQDPQDLLLSRSTTQENEQESSVQTVDVRDASPEFFSMRRHNSDYSYSSSSGTFYFPSAALTAIVPTVGSPVSEDEVWNEYDDLIDNVLTPVTSSTAEKGLRDENSTQDEKTPDRKTMYPKMSDMASSLRPDLSPFVGTQRRSEVFSGFELVASSPMDSSFDCSDEEEENTITIHSEGYKSLDANAPSKEQYAMESSTHEDINSMKLTPRSMANLRFGALMISKWLSFGRVLFSPAHYELINAMDDRVLVIDGLGTDWSYFTALTYPNLTVYSLGPGSVQTTGRNAQGPWQPLANHRHLSQNDMTSNFPFPKNFFAVVVFRFPTATTEAKMRMTLSECKRVLQPGGYIEVSSLDLDLTNMGNKARRAIRALKMMMQESVPDVCLKPASDNIQCLLGRRGFENLSRCVVGVPAAGMIGDSKTSSRDEQEMSFTKLMDDQSQAGDEVMTKMVAKVGRWWYLKTYEMCALPIGDVSGSIWNDIPLLRECEKQETAFKLFICYAQKPTLAKRRTVSL